MRRTPTTSSRVPLLAAALLVGACGPSHSEAPSPEPLALQIEEMLDASAEAWTRGDLEGFLDDYAVDATFVGSSGIVEGRDRIRQIYLDGYWSTGRPADGLRFDLLEIRPLGRDAAVTVGRYELFDRDTGAVNASGLFSLTLRRTDGAWEIVHDHSSADAGG